MKTAKERADAIERNWGGVYTGALSGIIEEAITEAVREKLEECAKLAELHPFFPDTVTGMRQDWMRKEIAAGIRARKP